MAMPAPAPGPGGDAPSSTIMDMCKGECSGPNPCDDKVCEGYGCSNPEEYDDDADPDACYEFDIDTGQYKVIKVAKCVYTIENGCKWTVRDRSETDEEYVCAPGYYEIPNVGKGISCVQCSDNQISNDNNIYTSPIGATKASQCYIESQKTQTTPGNNGCNPGYTEYDGKCYKTFTTKKQGEYIGETETVGTYIIVNDCHHN